MTTVKQLMTWRRAKRKYYYKHHEEIRKREREYGLKYYAKHKESIKQKRKTYAQINSGRVNAWVALRRAKKLQATPKWLTQEQVETIKQFYINCPKNYHVDHIYPLNGKECSGLHVPWNLQYLPAIENIRKGNRI